MSILEVLQYDFMRHAAICALLIAPLAGLLGSFVTLRGLAFFGEAIGHSAFAGVAVALLLGFSSIEQPALFLGALLGFSILAALAIDALNHSGALRTDTAIAIALTTLVALGSVLVMRTNTANPEQLLTNLMFGSILNVGPEEIAALLLILALTAAFYWRYYQRLTLLTLQPDYARAIGVPVRRISLLFLLLLTMTVVIMVRMVGALLVTAILVIPPATARHLASSLFSMLWIAAVLALIALEGGLLAATAWNLPTGPVMVLLAVSMFVLSLAWRGVRGAGKGRDEIAGES